MKCQNCQTEMKLIVACIAPAIKHMWCEQCGTVCNLIYYSAVGFSVEKEWHIPKSVETTKKLVDALIKEQNKNSDKIYRIAKDDIDKVDWGDDSRDR